MDGILLGLAAEDGIGDLDDRLAGNRREEAAQEGVGNLEPLVLAERDQRLLVRGRAHVELFLQQLEPREIVQAVELSETPEDLPEDLLLVACELLVEKRFGLVRIAHAPPPSGIADELLPELLLKRLDILLDHPERHVRTRPVHLFEYLFGGVVPVGIGEQAVDDPVSRHCVFAYWHGSK